MRLVQGQGMMGPHDVVVRAGLHEDGAVPGAGAGAGFEVGGQEGISHGLRAACCAREPSGSLLFEAPQSGLPPPLQTDPGGTLAGLIPFMKQPPG